MKLKNRGIKKIINNNWFIFMIAFKEAPVYTVATVINGFSQQMIIFVEHIYMIAYIVDCIQFHRPFLNVIIFIGSVFTVVILHFLWSGYISDIVTPKAIEKINKAIRLRLYKKASEIDLECYDNPDFYNDLVWSMSEAADRVGKVLDSMSNFFGAVGAILITGVFIFVTDKVGLIFAVVAFILTFIVSIKANKKQFKFDCDMKPIQRKRDYINRVFYLNDYAKEIRLSNVKAKLYEDYLESYKKLTETAKRNTKILVIYRFIQTL
jgi:ATP-binding cassette subfamily B protein